MGTGENDAKTLRVDANFLTNGEKKLRFQTNTDTCRQRLIQVCGGGQGGGSPGEQGAGGVQDTGDCDPLVSPQVWEDAK